MAFLPSDVIAGNKLFAIPDATPCHFGILTSCVHMAWTRSVCGRLEVDYSHSATIVYSNFPWPNAAEAQKAKVEEPAQGVLGARALHPGSSLADLYDPLAMPGELLKAHRVLDREVARLYGYAGDMAEAGIGRADCRA